MRRLAIHAIGAAVIAMAALSCENGSTTTVVLINGQPDTLQLVTDVDILTGAVTVTGEELFLSVGDTVTLAAVATNALGAVLGDVEISWGSTNPGVASITNEGVAVANAPGSTTLFATAGDISATLPVTVEDPSIGGGGPPPSPSLGSLSVTPPQATLTGTGATLQLSVAAFDSLGSSISPSVTWGTTNPAVVSVTQNGLVTSEGLGSAYVTVSSSCCTRDSTLVQVQPVGGASGIDWWADWRFSTGTSREALTDGGKFTGELCDFFRSSHGAVVSAAGRGFPAGMNNVFRALISDVSRCYMVTVQNQWAAPAVGEYQFHRFYYRLEAPDGFNPGNQHFFHNGTTGAPYETWWQLDAGRSVSGGEYLVSLVLNVNDGGTVEEWAQVTLRTSATYRFEYRQYRISSNEIRNAVRIYDESGALLFDTGDFIMAGGSGNALANHPVRVQDAASHFQRLEMGYNGSGVIPNIGTRYGYFGGVAVKVSANGEDWIGPYTPAGG